MTPNNTESAAPPAPQTPAIYVASKERLAEVCRAMAGAPRLAVDTEFVGEKYYFPRLEIIQITDGERTAIIDVPALRDFEPLAALMRDPSKLKIFHAAGQDLEIIRRATGVLPLPLFDTQVAASLLGHGSQISLANLIRGLLSIDVSGKQTTSDWSHRPLSSEQLAYAATDVAHLHALHLLLDADLTRLRRRPWYDDEQAERIHSLVEEEEQDDALLYRRVKDWMSLGGRELAVLRELAIWRENAASERNLPRKTVLTDEGMIEIAKFQPDNREQAQKLRRVNVGQVMKNFDELRSAMERARRLPKSEWPSKPLSERVDIPTGLLELCQALIRTEAELHGVAPTILATSSDLQQVILRRSNPDEADSPLLKGWRRDLAGQKLLDLLAGRLVVTVGPEGNLVFSAQA